MSWVSRSFLKSFGEGLPCLKKGSIPVRFHGVHQSNEDVVVLHPFRPELTSALTSGLQEEVSLVFFTEIAVKSFQETGKLEGLKVRGLRVSSIDPLPVIRVCSEVPLNKYLLSFLSVLGKKVEETSEAGAHLQIVRSGFLRTDQLFQVVWGGEGGDFSFPPMSDQEFEEDILSPLSSTYTLIQTEEQNRPEVYIAAVKRGDLIISLVPSLPPNINPAAVIRQTDIVMGLKRATIIRENPEALEQIRRQPILTDDSRISPENAARKLLRMIEPEEHPRLSDPFNADPIIALEIERLIRELGVEVVVETGTYRGTTTNWFARRVQEVHTVEILPENFKMAQQYLGRLGNVRQYLGSSEVVLRDFLEQMVSRTTAPILFYLDAHWQDFWPLLDEIRVIAGVCPDRCILVIDDFQVPNRNYQFDSYHDQPNNWNFVREVVHLAIEDPVHWYNGRTERPEKGVGKFFCVPRKWFREEWVREEEGERYSTI